MRVIDKHELLRLMKEEAEGKLIGVLYRADAEKRLQDVHAHHHMHG